MLSVQTLVRIAEALKIEPGDLLHGLSSDMFAAATGAPQTPQPRRTRDQQRHAS